jgi:hypothetical protein
VRLRRGAAVNLRVDPGPAGRRPAVSLVLDCSATLTFVYQDEVGPVAGRIFERVAATRAFVPFLWRLEVANGLQAGVRRGRIDAAFRDAALADLAALDIVTDRETDAQARSATLGLAEGLRLTLLMTARKLT